MALAVKEAEAEELAKRLRSASGRRRRADTTLAGVSPSAPCPERLAATEEALGAAREEASAAVLAHEKAAEVLSLCKGALSACEVERAEWEKIAGERDVELRKVERKPRQTLWGRLKPRCGPGLGLTAYPETSVAAGLYCVVPLF